jgi:hypothetical protein
MRLEGFRSSPAERASSISSRLSGGSLDDGRQRHRKGSPEPNLRSASQPLGRGICKLSKRRFFRTRSRGKPPHGQAGLPLAPRDIRSIEVDLRAPRGVPPCFSNGSAPKVDETRSACSTGESRQVGWMLRPFASDPFRALSVVHQRFTRVCCQAALMNCKVRWPNYRIAREWT